MTGEWITGTIGVIVPTYNRVCMLKDALESIFNQTYRDIEIIVMDDGSKDGTADYLASLHDPRLSYVVNEHNIGLACNVNKGMALLSDSVKWCTVLCDDDYYDVNCIASLNLMVVRSQAQAIVHSHIVFVGPRGEFLHDALDASPEETAFEYVKGRSEFVTERYLSGILLSRKAFNEVGGYPVFTTGMAADDAMVFAISLKDRLVYSADAIVYVRLHADAESKQLADISGHLSSMQEYRAYCLNVAITYGGYGHDELTLLDERLLTHVYGMNARLWVGSIKQLIRQKAPDFQHKINALYNLGMDREFIFPSRVRLSSFFGLRFGFCLEKIGIYRNVWRQVSKLQKFAKCCR
jgi:glycosyltransferase involved in cell wall biosynthesis